MPVNPQNPGDVLRDFRFELPQGIGKPAIGARSIATTTREGTIAIWDRTAPHAHPPSR